ncbi:GNAT family N-acetyltransferase [Pseudoxanthomonas sacheonensis]|uniref:GNAT family N-acetyltransferase n=1 Tax=Pseudoxanthomonas sacheonensis TaxID=443615 RepID=UPI0013D2B0A8|nr:GNAT family N-acetyltransferase [Pseudoxanthomonas sacheonensis]KAF1706394.1 N-acetyltransferase [Pseudoxanthomonas sacheonensis]
MSELEEIVLVERFPGVDDYRRLRSVSGLSPKSAEAAALGLANTLYGVSLKRGDDTIGMGRIIGDGGCFFVVVDIAVQPEYQRRGLGKRIMGALDAWLRAHAPDSSNVSLFADGDARHLYAQYGFVEAGPVSVGMDYIVRR